MILKTLFSHIYWSILYNFCEFCENRLTSFLFRSVYWNSFRQTFFKNHFVSSGDSKYFEPNNTFDNLRAGVCLRLEGFHKRTHNGSGVRRKLWPHSCLIAAVFSRLHNTNAENMNSFMRDTLRRYMKPVIHPILTEMLSVIYYISDVPHLWRVLNTMLN